MVFTGDGRIRIDREAIGTCEEHRMPVLNFYKIVYLDRCRTQVNKGSLSLFLQTFILLLYVKEL
jgi:hypothetical protein